jgi:hypothetical protein
MCVKWHTKDDFFKYEKDISIAHPDQNRDSLENWECTKYPIALVMRK